MTTPRTIAPYGSWASPFPLESLTDGVVFIGDVHAAGGRRWWLEGRPEESGRVSLVRRERDGSTTRLTPPGFNVRSRVHEYGGGACLIVPGARDADDLVIVSEFATGRLHRVVAAGELVPLTPAGEWRYADMALDAPRHRLVAVREDHTPEAVARHGEWVNDLVAIDLGDGSVTVLDTGHDFYAAPRPSPDGRRLAWLDWDHPNLPWDGTTLRIADAAGDGSLAPSRIVAGSPGDWISQPRWSADGRLHFAAEPDGWMQLYRWIEGADGAGSAASDRIERVHAPIEAEFASPDWVFGNREYAFLDDGGILAVARNEGRDRLYRIRTPGPDAQLEVVDVPWTEISSIAVDGGRVVVRAVSPSEPAVAAECDLDGGGIAVLMRATNVVRDPADIVVGRHVTFPSAGGRVAYGNYYPPNNRHFAAPEGELPPLIVTSHGGPTSSAFSGYATTIQLLTSRGFAVLDVDYGGSTGYGRAYRRSLEGQWGIVDVDDCVAGATWLAEQGLADPARLAIRGGSASGFTTLAALAFRRTFSAGTSLFGLGDLRAFVKDTHKFESRYLENLVGPYPAEAQRYQDRSPALHADRITVPVLIQQGAEDRVVPPAEAERIVDALFERHVPHAYLLFPGEDHGFRGREAILRSIGSELDFYGQVFGFTPADDIEPVEIAFLDEFRARTKGIAPA